MSFRFGGSAHAGKNNSNSSTDSTINTSSKTLSSLLNDPVAADDAAIKGMFKINPCMKPFFKDFSRRETEEFSDMKVWGRPYFQMMDDILAKNGLPVQLKYLCVIESGLKAGTVSCSGATGPWQLMHDEGKMFGLVMKKENDERKDFRKSTEVAAGLLKKLYNQFGDWLLVVAAYNCGNGAMRRAIAKAGTKNYWVVQNYLSEQARNHVKKYIATHYIFEGSGGWTTITNDEAVQCQAAISNLIAQKDSAAANDITAIEISGKYNSGVLAGALMIDRELFRRLNPNLDENLFTGKVCVLKLPTDKIPLFLANKAQILEQSVQLLLCSASSK